MIICDYLGLFFAFGLCIVCIHISPGRVFSLILVDSAYSGFSGVKLYILGGEFRSLGRIG